MNGLQTDFSAYISSFIVWTALTFILAYTFLAPWWRTAFGRMIVLLDASLMVALTPTVFYYDFGINFTGSVTATWIILIALLPVPFVITARLVYLWRLQDGAYRSRNTRVWHGIKKAYAAVCKAVRRTMKAVSEVIYPPDARSHLTPPDPLIQTPKENESQGADDTARSVPEDSQMPPAS
jgi:hypothetical protein